MGSEVSDSFENDENYAITGKNLDQLRQHTSIVFDPYQYGWPAIGPVTNFCDGFVREQNRTIASDENGLAKDEECTILKPVRQSNVPLISVLPAPRALTRNGTPMSDGSRQRNVSLKSSGDNSPHTALLDPPTLVDIRTEVDVGGLCFPLSKTWDLSIAKSSNLEYDIAEYTRSISLELGLSFDAEFKLMSSIRKSILMHIMKLFENRSFLIDDRYGARCGTDLQLGELGLESDSSLGGKRLPQLIAIAQNEGLILEENKKRKMPRNPSQESVERKALPSKCNKKAATKKKKENSGHRDSQKKDEVPVEVWVEVKPEDHNTDSCGICHCGGDLLCCDRCPRAFHLACLGVSEESLPEGEWVCQGCYDDDRQWETEPLLRVPRELDKTHVLEVASHVLDLVSSHEFATPFLVPLDTVALGVHAEYDQIVQYRMDLGQVRSRLQRALYELGLEEKSAQAEAIPYTILRFVKDVRTVWHNCIIFNAEGSAVVRMAKHLSKVFEKALSLQLMPRMRSLEVTRVRDHLRKQHARAADVLEGWKLRSNSSALELSHPAMNKAGHNQADCSVVHRRKEVAPSSRGRKRTAPMRFACTPPTPAPEEEDSEPSAVVSSVPSAVAQLRTPIPVKSMTNLNCQETRITKNEDQEANRDAMKSPRTVPISGIPNVTRVSSKSLKSSKKSPGRGGFGSDSALESPSYIKKNAKAPQSVCPPSKSGGTSPVKNRIDANQDKERTSPRLRRYEETALIPGAITASPGPQRDTREGKLWKEICGNNVKIGTPFYKDFGPHGIFKGKVISFKYPFVTVRYEDNDVEDLEPGEFKKAVDSALQSEYLVKYEEQKLSKWASKTGGLKGSR